MSFDELMGENVELEELFQSLWDRAVSFDNTVEHPVVKAGKFQSLWDRAVSFDLETCDKLHKDYGFNPFGTGRCLSTASFPISNASLICFNPFGTGRCLSTLRSH